MKSALKMSLDELKDDPIAKAVIHIKDIVQSELVGADRSILELFNELIRTAGIFEPCPSDLGYPHFADVRSCCGSYVCH